MKKQIFFVQLAFIQSSWHLQEADQNSTALQRDRKMQWQGCAQADLLPTALCGHCKSSFTLPFDVGQTEQHSF